MSLRGVLGAKQSQKILEALIRLILKALSPELLNIAISVALLLLFCTMQVKSNSYFNLQVASEKIANGVGKELGRDLKDKSKQKFSNVQTIAVVSFRLLTPRGCKGIDEKFANDLTNEISNLGYFKIIERRRIKEILNEQSYTQSGFVNEKSCVEIGKLTGVQSMIFGEIIVNEKNFGVYVRIVDIEKGSILWNTYKEINIKNDGDYPEIELNQSLWINTTITACRDAVNKLIENLKKNKKDIQSIAIPNFANISSSGYFGMNDAVTTEAILQLVNKGYQVVERGKIESIFTEAKLGLSGLLDSENSVKLGNLLGVDTILLGDILVNQKGRRFDDYGSRRSVQAEGRVTLKIVSVKTGEILAIGIGKGKMSN